MRDAREGAPAARAEARRAAAAVLALAALWILPWLSRAPARTWGWDEAMHAELPALQMLFAAADGDPAGVSEALHGCGQYPFGWPLVLAVVQAVTGPSELACRMAGTLAWCAALFGLFLLGQELARAQRGAGGGARRGDALVPWLALALGALSPLGLAYGGTLFLEVPSALVAVFALRAWLRRGAHRGEARRARRELAAGAWLAAAFFTKFNYGLLLGFGLALDWLVELALEARAGRLAAFLRRSAWLAAPPLVGFAWWLLLPLPEGAEVAARHRAALAGFLTGNLEGRDVPWSVRALHWAGYLAPGLLALGATLVGAARGALEAARPGARALLLALLGAGLPVWLHPFHLDRFLLPIAPALWALGGLGLARLAPRAPRARLAAGAALVALGLVTWEPGVRWLAGRTGLLDADPARRAFQLETFAGWRRLDAFRPLPTAGLERAEAAELFGLVAAAARPDERVGWLGLSSELSPAAIHVALLQAGGARARFRRDAQRPMDVTFEGTDPGWDDARLAQYAAGFDVIFTTDPPDLRGRAAREFVRGYQARLMGLGWEPRELGAVELARPLQEPLRVTLYACRPKPEPPR